MAPSKKNKTKKVEKDIDFSSPASKRKITMNSKAVFRKGLNLMLAVNAIVDSPSEAGYSPYQQKCIDRAEADKEKVNIFDAFSKEHRFHLRKQGGPTGLTQDEWEELTSKKNLRSVVTNQPEKIVGELLKGKCTLHDKAQFFKAVTKEEALLKRCGETMVDDALKAARELKKAKNLAAKAAAQEGMVPEF